MKCLICNKNFIALNNHIKKHNLTTKEYYDRYLKVDNEDRCRVCGKITRFMGIRYGYTKHCSYKCANNDEQEKIKKYTETRMLHQQQTNLKRYGHINQFQRKEIINKNHSEIANNKRKQTYIDRFGTDHPSKNEQVKQKTKQSNLDRFGYVCPFNKPEIIKRSHSNEAIIKANNTKRLNNSFNKSKMEDITYSILLTKFTSVIRQYYSKKYPYHCDFYLPDIDLYIECNFHWTHGGMKYDGRKIKCKQQLAKWKEKAETSQYYKNAIYTWTILDKKKFAIARRNKLKYLVIWNFNEINTIIELIKDNYM